LSKCNGSHEEKAHLGFSGFLLYSMNSLEFHYTSWIIMVLPRFSADSNGFGIPKSRPFLTCLRISGIPWGSRESWEYEVRLFPFENISLPCAKDRDA